MIRLLLAAFAIVVLSADARAQPAMGAQELDEHRGGLATPVGEVGFGAAVRTYVDGALALETHLTWTPAGLQTEQVSSALPPGVAVGFLPSGAPGFPTTIVHDLRGDRIASFVINTGAERAIRQETDVTLHMPHLPQLQQQVAAARLASALQEATVGAGLR